MATGPGLTAEVMDRVYETDWPKIGISDVYRHGRKIDFYYACDQKWWGIHIKAVREWRDAGNAPNGLWCTEDPTAKKFPDLFQIKGKGGKQLSTNPRLIHYGGNSGFQILNIAYLLGLKNMILLGFNMSPAGGKSHFFGDHPQGLSRSNSYRGMNGSFEKVKHDLIKHGVEVVNATHGTFLTHFPKMDLDDAIAHFSR